MNAVEIEAAVSVLAAKRFHAKEFQTLCVNAGLKLNKP